MTATLSPARQAALENLHEARRARVADRIEDLEFLAGQGVPIGEAVSRVGWTLSAAMRALYRHGHPLASRVSRAEWNARRAG